MYFFASTHIEKLINEMLNLITFFGYILLTGGG